MKVIVSDVFYALPLCSFLNLLPHLICLSFLHLGLCEEPLRVGVGLLTFLSGFEITYSILEPSLAVVGLLACVHVGIALVCGYLMLVHDFDQYETRL